MTAFNSGSAAEKELNGVHWGEISISNEAMDEFWQQLSSVERSKLQDLLKFVNSHEILGKEAVSGNENSETRSDVCIAREPVNHSFFSGHAASRTPHYAFDQSLELDYNYREFDQSDIQYQQTVPNAAAQDPSMKLAQLDIQFLQDPFQMLEDPDLPTEFKSSQGLKLTTVRPPSISCFSEGSLYPSKSPRQPSYVELNNMPTTQALHAGIEQQSMSSLSRDSSVHPHLPIFCPSSSVHPHLPSATVTSSIREKRTSIKNVLAVKGVKREEEDEEEKQEEGWEEGRTEDNGSETDLVTRKKMRRRLQNRTAAARCRYRKKENYEAMVKELEQSKRENEAYKRVIVQLNATISDVSRLARLHVVQCGLNLSTSQLELLEAVQ